jgi:hypothetical protein
MPVRVRYSASIELSSGTQEQKDLGNVTWSMVTDGLGEGGTWKTLVPAASTDLELHLDNMANVNFLAIKTSSKDPTQAPVELDFKRETAGGEVFKVKPLPSSKEGHFFMTTDGLTALFVTNSGSVDMEVIITASGD